MSGWSSKWRKIRKHHAERRSKASVEFNYKHFKKHSDLTLFHILHISTINLLFHWNLMFTAVHLFLKSHFYFTTGVKSDTKNI